MDEIRARYLRDKVMTASPARRVVMLYDRLGLDVRQARAATDPMTLNSHVSHALDIVTELYGSLNAAAGGPAENLASIYGFLINELMTARSTGEPGRLAASEKIVTDLRQAWAGAAEQLASGEGASPAASLSLRA